MSVELYRQGKLAESLVEALDVLVEEGKIPGALALKIMEEYDASIVEAFNTRVTSKAVFKGKLDVYRYCDNVWTFVISAAHVRLAPTLGSSKRDEQELTLDKVRMVLVDAKVASQPADE